MRAEVQRKEAAALARTVVTLRLAGPLQLAAASPALRCLALPRLDWALPAPRRLAQLS
jgi:hypothetical protein